MITYTNLNPGDYEFCVKATNSDGIWNQNYQSINIYIKPPYWQSWWFRIIAFFVIAGFIYGLFLIRLKRINKQTKKLEKQVEDRTLHIQKQKEEISSQNEELIRLNSNKEKLVSILSHDLKGPIANMLSMVDILEDDWNSFTDQEKIDIFKRLKKNSQSNLELIDESLEFVRLSWNTIKPNISKRTISTIFKNLENTYLESLKRKNIHLSISGQTDEVVETDHDILRLILMNYISNAIKFTPKGKKIELKVKTIENKVHICVVDEGIGIPEDKLKTLFSEMDSFSRKGTEGEKSYGIGLQLVKEYAQIINAKTEVKSTVDVGSHFCVIFSVNWQ
jgi:signal transduction histidine kinase